MVYITFDAKNEELKPYEDCSNLITITYEGTKVEWNILNSNNAGGFVSGAVVTCNDGIVTIA